MYVKGEVVWAKIKGFPWWPGVVAKVVEDKTNPNSNVELLVNFVGENSHAQLSLDKVAKYQQKYNEFAKMKKKKLLESIEIADKILRGETTFENESEKLKEEYRNMQNDIKPKPKPIENPSLKKAKSDRPSDKSPVHGADSNLQQYESDQSSTQEAELGGSPSEKNKKKAAQAEKKEGKRKLSLSKTGNAMAIEKSPITGKSVKTGINGKREAEENQIELEEPKPAKNLKTNENIDERDNKKPEELPNKLQRQNSRQSTASAPSAVTTNKSSASASTDNTATVTAAVVPVTSAVVATPTMQVESNIKPNKASTKSNIKGFEDLFNLLIEKISSNGSASVSGSIIEKSIEDVISKINPDTVGISEILENNLGKNIHILIVLLDELCNLPSLDSSIESELSALKDRLFSYTDIIKNRLTLHFIENVDYSSHWLKKLEEKRSKDGDKKSREPVRANKSQQIEEEGNNNNNNLSARIEEEIESDKAGPSLQINFEEFRFEGDKKKVLADKNQKMVTTTSTTKMTKPIYNPGGDKKGDNKQKENVMNPNLRKKICLKMCKILQEKYRLEKDTAQELTLRIEHRIRLASPDMQAEYKEKVLVILKLLKFALLNVEDFTNEYNVDFNALKERLDDYQVQHGEVGMDAGLGDDSPPLTKEISRNSSVMNGKMGEVK